MSISILICGSGLIGPRHALAVHNNPNTRLFGIMDHHNGGPLAQKYGVPWFKSIKEMIETSPVKPDAAIVATPNHTHIPLSAELASHGIHLLIEKPLSSDPKDSKALYEYTNDLNIKVLVGHHRRFNPYVLQTKSLLGDLGKIIAIQGTWCLPKPSEYFKKAWRTDSSKGGGTLLINLVHDIDILIYLFGSIEKVYAELLTQQRSNNCDEGASLILKFSSGVVGTFVCSDNVVSPFNFECGTGENPTIPFHSNTSGVYRIFGSDATLSFPDMKVYKQVQKSWLNSITEDTPITADELVGVPFDLQLHHFVKFLNGTEECLCTCIDGIMALLTVDAVIKSISTGLPQFVKSFDDLESNIDALKLA